MEKADKLYIVSPAPHVRKEHSIQTMMLDTILSLLPAGVVSVIIFGVYSLGIIFTSVTFAVLSEIFVNLLRRQKFTVSDLSCIVTGLLFAYTLPPRLPLVIVIIGIFVAIVFGKHIYGGLGYNPFNPALIGRAFVHIAFPQQMGNFTFDAVSTATPLTILKHFPEQVHLIPDVSKLILGNYSGSLGETSVVCLLIGYFYLVLKKHINPFVPWVYITTVGLITILHDASHLWIYLLSGGLFLGGIFMITDPVTTPVSYKGKIIFAVGCGLLTSLIRYWGSYPEGVCFSILLMNMLTPLIDEYTIRKKFGYKK
ncbi:MAG: RnfABCDGE type electron transport complex subunit D [Endomicrobia bacterium]|nr:RnfABCDGE type electron transport complex subunit D [Endomicrobiia bacterium]